MRNLLSFVLIFFFGAPVCNAAIIFRLEGPIEVQQGSVGQFDVFISSNAGPAELNFIELNAFAGAGDGSGGVFTSSSTTFLLQGNNDDAFDLSDPLFPGIAYSINQGPSIFVGSEVLYARLFLNTDNATVGNHSLSLIDTSVFNFRIPVETSVEISTQSSALNYTITAIPEPGFASVALVASTIAAVRRRRQRPATAQ